MLYYTTIDHATLDLLVDLLQYSGFKEMRLAGGTSLALQMGHRKSIDLDLFGKLDVDEYEVSDFLSSYDSAVLLNKSRNIQSWVVNGVKVDIVNYSYPWIEDVNVVDGIRLAGEKDIAAMKLAAITGRGTKKDFIDLYFLLQKYSLEDILRFYAEKYREGSLFLVIKSLSYFEDADADPSPFMLQEVDWSDIKDVISDAVNAYLSKL